MNYRTVQVPLSDKEQEALRIAASKACRRPRDQARYILLQALGLSEERHEVSAQPASTRANLIEAVRDKDSLLDMLRSLRNQTNAILFDWHKFGDLPKDQPVNWATVLCCSASAGIDSIGASFLSVVVESASPDADKFQAWLSDKLAETGWPGIHVITEW